MESKRDINRMTKREARERMRQLRREISGEERERRNQELQKHFREFMDRYPGGWLFPFVSYGTEADTIQIIREVLTEGKRRVAVPRVEGREMEFYAITSMKELKPGYQGILEPVTTQCIPAADGILLLPGLAFDREKNRVGYGGGYYDRYLARCDGKGLVTAALTYDFQVADRIEAEEFDWKPQWIITDKRIF